MKNSKGQNLVWKRAQKGKPLLGGGLTLLELLLGATLIGLVGLSFAALYGTAQHYMVRDALSSSVQAEATFAMEHMKRHLMKANGVTDPTGPFPAPPQTTVTFQWIPSIGAATITSIYRLTGTLLEYQENGGTSEAIARHVSSLAFTRQTSTQTTIDLTVSQTAGPVSYPVTLSASIIHRGIPPS